MNGTRLPRSGPTLSHSANAGGTSSQCDPVDTRIRTNVEKRGEGLTGRGDGGGPRSATTRRRRVCRLTPGIARELVLAAVLRCDQLAPDRADAQFTCGRERCSSFGNSPDLYDGSPVLF